VRGIGGYSATHTAAAWVRIARAREGVAFGATESLAKACATVTVARPTVAAQLLGEQRHGSGTARSLDGSAVPDGNQLAA